MPRLLLIFTIVLAGSVSAQTIEITPTVGFQTGGSVRTENGGEVVEGEFENPVAFGVFITRDWGHGSMMDVLVSNQTTEAAGVDVSVTYIQIGGRVYVGVDGAVWPYIALTAGGTHLSLDGEQGLFLSGSAGGGVDFQLSKRTALRLDGRFFGTLLGSSGAIGCSTGGALVCIGSAGGGLFVQFAGSAGVVVRF